MLSKNEAKTIRALHGRKGREEKQQFIAEGVKLVSEILTEQPGIVTSLYATRECIENLRFQKSAALKFVEVTGEELSSISMLSAPNGVLAVCRMHAISFTRETPASSVYLDEIRDPGNFGTIIRLCDWYGISTLYCSPGCCELYNPKVIQSTMGAFLRVNVIYRELAEAARSFQAVYGAVLDGKSLYEEQLKPGLIVLGNEAHGISVENLSCITNPLTIPRHPASRTESLNAAMAASIICSEFFRRSLI